MGGIVNITSVPQFSNLKLAMTSTVTQTLVNGGAPSYQVAAGQQTFTISHNLGFKPAYLVYVQVPSNFDLGGSGELQALPLFDWYSNDIADFPLLHIRATVTETDLKIHYQHGDALSYVESGGPIYQVRYYLLAETSS